MGLGGAPFSFNGNVTVLNSTIAGNGAGQGGGVFALGDGATATLGLTNTILFNSLNGATDFQAATFGGAISLSGGNNVIVSPGLTGTGPSGGNAHPLLDDGRCGFRLRENQLRIRTGRLRVQPDRNSLDLRWRGPS